MNSLNVLLHAQESFNIRLTRAQGPAVNRHVRRLRQVIRSPVTTAPVFIRISDEWGFSVVKDPTFEEMDDCVRFVPEITVLVMAGAFTSSKNPIHPISPQALKMV
jgi:hypothetical protein